MATQVSVRLDDDLEDDLEEFRNSQRFKPNKSDVIRQALREYLDRELED